MKILNLILFITIVLTLFSIVNSLELNSDDKPRYTVFNTETSANFATFELDTLKTTTLSTLNNYQILNSTFNNHTLEITSIVSNLNSPDSISLYKVDTESWVQTEIASWSLSTYNFSSIEYDQTNDEFNLFATLIIPSKNTQGTFTVAKLSSIDGSFEIIDVLNGDFDASTYHWIQKTFFVHHSNSSGWFLNGYNNQGKRVYTHVFNLSNINPSWSILGTPYAMAYFPSTGMAYAANNLESDQVPSSPSIYSLFFTFDDFLDNGAIAANNVRKDIIRVISLAKYPGYNLNYITVYTRNTKKYPSGVVVYLFDLDLFDFDIVEIEYPLLKIWADY